MTVTEDGKATLSDGGNVLGTVQLEADELESLRLMLAAADFNNMKIYYGGGEPHPEGFLDTLVLEKGGEPKRVTMEQGASFTEATAQERALFTRVRGQCVTHREHLHHGGGNSIAERLERLARLTEIGDGHGRLRCRLLRPHRRGVLAHR